MFRRFALGIVLVLIVPASAEATVSHFRPGNPTVKFQPTTFAKLTFDRTTVQKYFDPPGLYQDTLVLRLLACKTGVPCRTVAYNLATATGPIPRWLKVQVRLSGKEAAKWRRRGFQLRTAVELTHRLIPSPPQKAPTGQISTGPYMGIDNPTLIDDESKPSLPVPTDPPAICCCSQCAAPSPPEEKDPPSAPPILPDDPLYTRQAPGLGSP